MPVDYQEESRRWMLDELKILPSASLSIVTRQWLTNPKDEYLRDLKLLEQK